MPLWSSLMSYFLDTSISNSTPQSEEMNGHQSTSQIKVRVEQTKSRPLSPSRIQLQTTSRLRPIDPSQTLQVPFHESDKAETPFITPLGGSMIIITPPHSPMHRARTQSPDLRLTSPEGKRDLEENGTWTDGWVKIVDLTKEEKTDTEDERKAKKRCKKEWRGEDVAEPVKKKCKDQNRSSWAKNSREEKPRGVWRPGNNQMRKGRV